VAPNPAAAGAGVTAAGAHWAMREHVTDTIWIKRQKTDSEFPDFLFSRFHLFRHRPDLQLKLST